MTRKQLSLIGAAVLGLGALTSIGITAKPAAENYVAPLVKEQINTSINGKVNYDSLTIGMDGTVWLENVVVNDTAGHKIATAPTVEVGLNVLKAPTLLFSDAEAMSLISSVTVENPDVHVWQLSDGTWNVQQLVKSSSTSDSSSFTGSVIVNDGTVAARLSDGTRYEMEDVDGTISLRDNPVVDGAVKAVFDGEEITARGNINTKNLNDFAVYVQADSINAIHVNQLLKSRNDISISGGFIDDVHVNIKSDGNNGYTMSGNLNLTDIDGAYVNGGTSYAITEGQARIMLNKNQAIISASDALINGEEFQVDGVIELADDTNLNLTVLADQASLLALAPDQGIDGLASANLQITGTTVSPKISGHILGENISYNGLVIDSVESDISYTEGKADLGNLEAYMGDGVLAGRATYDVDNTDFEAQLTAEALDLSAITAAVDISATGTVSGLAHVKGRQNRVTSITGDVYGEDITYSGVAISQARATFTGDGENYTVSQINALIGEGEFTAYGTLQNGEMNLSFNANAIPAALASQYLNNTVDGNITAYGTVSGTTDNPTAEAHISSNEIHIADARYDQILADVTLHDHVATISRGIIIDGEGEYTVTGTARLAGTRALDLSVKADKVRLENAIRPFVEFPITGWVTTENHITGTIDSPVVNGYAHMWDGSIQGKLVTDLYADYNYQGDVLTVTNGKAQAYGATATAYGTMVGSNLNFTFDGDQIDLGRLLTNEDIKIDGYADVKGTLTGTLDKPMFDGSVVSNALQLNSVPITNVKGNVYVDPSVVNLQNFSFTEDKFGKYTVKGGVMLDEPHRLFGTIQVETASINNLIHMLQQDTDSFDGQLNGEIELGGQLDNPSFDVNGTITDFSIDGNVIGNAVVDADLTNRKFTIRKLQLPVKDGLIAAGGVADLDGDADIQIAANRVNIKPFLPLVSKDIDATGIVSSVINISGKTNNPKVELSAELENGSLNGIALDKAFALATMENKVINVQRIMGFRDKYQVSAYGKVPLAALYTSGYLPPGDNKAMDLTVDFNEADLAVVPLMTNAVKSAEGPLSGAVHITGSYDDPEATGTVTVRNGTMKIDTIGNPMEEINGNLIFTGKQMDFQSTLNMGKGNAGLAAKVTWNHRALTSYNAAVQLDKLDLANEYVSGPINGELYITEMKGIPTLTGTINLENNQFKIPLSFESSGESTNLGLDVTVHAGKNVRLYDKLLYNMLITGDVRFKGSTNRPNPDGSFKVESGIFKYLNHTFNITKGNANFERGSFLPRLLLEATNTTSSYDIKLGVSGTVDMLDMTLTSEPQLSRERIISLLTFGRGAETNSSAVSSQDANNLFVSGLQMLTFGYVQDAVQNSLGLDMINITTGSLNPDEPVDGDTSGNYNIEIGKYIIPNLMGTYGQGVNNNMNKYGINYKVDKHLKFAGWRTNDNGGYFGTTWTRQF